MVSNEQENQFLRLIPLFSPEKQKNYSYNTFCKSLCRAYIRQRQRYLLVDTRSHILGVTPKSVFCDDESHAHTHRVYADIFYKQFWHLYKCVFVLQEVNGLYRRSRYMYENNEILKVKDELVKKIIHFKKHSCYVVITSCSCARRMFNYKTHDRDAIIHNIPRMFFKTNYCFIV